MKVIVLLNFRMKFITSYFIDVFDKVAATASLGNHYGVDPCLNGTLCCSDECSELRITDIVEVDGSIRGTTSVY